MQYAFAYFYYLMGVRENVTSEDVFDEMDTDKSRLVRLKPMEFSLKYDTVKSG